MKLTLGERKLLKTIADRDTGQGVAFSHAPRGRWQLDGTDYVVNNRTFWALTGNDLVDAGGGHDDPVKITQAGRDYLAGEAQPTPVSEPTSEGGSR